jgi:integrase
MTKTEATKKLREIIARETAGGPKPTEDITLRWFWEHRYWPMHKSKLKASSRYQLEWIAKKHILPRFGDKPIVECERFDMQTYLNQLAVDGYGVSLIHKARTYLKAIFDEAMEQKFLSSNPARKLDKPEAQGAQKTILSRTQVSSLLGALNGRDRLIFRLLVCCGFRPGELFVLRWDDWEPGQVRIDEAVWQGIIGKPKTQGSESSIYIPPQAEKELSEWMLACGQTSPTDFIFAREGGSPLSKREWLEERLRPIAQSLQIEGVTYQVLRRTFATWMQKCGTIKDVQRMLRHTSPTMTLGVYMQAIPESVKQAVNTLEEMFAEPKVE